jgi:hypothetical protein
MLHLELLMPPPLLPTSTEILRYLCFVFAPEGKKIRRKIDGKKTEIMFGVN